MSPLFVLLLSKSFSSMRQSLPLEGRGWAILILGEREVGTRARMIAGSTRLRLDEIGSAALRASPAEPRPSQRMHCWAQAAGCRRTRVLQGVAAVLLQPSLKTKQ